MLGKDERVSWSEFQFLSPNDIRHLLMVIRHNRNLDQLTQARLLLMTYNVNASKGKSMEDISEFLPYPKEWRLINQSYRLPISSATARDILHKVQKNKLKSKYVVLLYDFLDEIEHKANE